MQLERAENVIEVITELREYWPLTLRQIYYRLVGKGFIPNTVSHYNMLSRLLKWMRIDERLPWDVLEDRVRVITDKRGFDDIRSFIYQETRNYLTNYTRCLIQGQGKHIEVWTEKEALFRIFDGVVYPYCLRTVVCRGYNSVTFIADFYKRAERAIMKGQQPIVLYFGDLDPSGVDMLEATIITLQDEFGLCGVEFKRIGLNPEHIAKYNLFLDPEAAKRKDTRYKKFVKRFGPIAVELDALHPFELEDMIRESIETEIDMDMFNTERDQENAEIVSLADIKDRAYKALRREFSEMFE